MSRRTKDIRPGGASANSPARSASDEVGNLRRVPDGRLKFLTQTLKAWNEQSPYELFTAFVCTLTSNSMI